MAVTRTAKLREPRLRSLGPRAAAPELAVLVLHGGRQTSLAPVRGYHLAYLRMLAVACSLRRSPAGIWLLRNRMRGWNEPGLDAIADARWALERIRAQRPEAAIVLVGHSLGGRVALRLAGEQQVRGVCALAPWVEDDEPIEQLRGKAVLIAHGSDDEITSPDASADYAERAQRQQHPPTLTYLRLSGTDHGMLRRWTEWHKLTRRFVAALAAGAERATG